MGLMKKCIKALAILVLLVFTTLSITGCTLFDKESIMNSFTAETSEANENVADTVITALQNKDSDSIKNLFSNNVKELCGTSLDDGIAYMFDLYKGDFVEITQTNSSTYTSGEMKYLRPVCVFKTTEHFYKLTWNSILGNANEEGVYSMRFEIWEDEGLNQGGGDLFIAGIETDKTSDICNASFELLKTIYHQEDLEKYREEFKELFSDEVKETLTDEKVDEFFNCDSIAGFHSLTKGNCWINYDDTNNMSAWLLSRKSPQSYMYIVMDKNQTDKIAYLKIGKLDEENNVDKYLEDITENGVYIEE